MKHYRILIILIVLIGCNDTPSSKAKTTKALAGNIPTTTSETRIKSKEDNALDKNIETTNNQDDWYWKNTQMSKNNAFENWEHGLVDLVMEYRLRHNETTPKNLKVGYIDDNGSINITLPENTPTETSLDNLGNLVFYDIQDISTLNYGNPDAGYLSKTTLNVLKNGELIGALTLGNSVRVTYNLTNQSTLSMGDEGYLISWAYLEEAASMKGTEKTKNKVRRDGTNTLEVENTVVYDLDFKPGWNFIKTEVIGKYDLVHERGLNASWFKKHHHRVVSEIPEDAAYYFRFP
ncbi:hypothetical protein QSE00_12640 [Arenibacter sp. M-2]|uniref:hypothetical protein n=1 Tax=unclassified Arenibacter TaxID=2615047 RepID=UPI000D773CEF|nr:MULTISPECIES: hypothetical protein [unclassified Arenibacter]MDL5512669.1 hypothetical protein [Arenibacter sp. M-2]PXX28340.1 hypothetical protein C7972_105195 [Arenibacter sp. ARW7G5Y1]